jgi:hypothetical protein
MLKGDENIFIKGDSKPRFENLFLLQQKNKQIK